MRIGQVAEQARVSVRALRYYEVDSGEAEPSPWPVHGDEDEVGPVLAAVHRSAGGG
ncbi:MerR family transcriptional regulator [Streptomyces phaeochromogenes]|uniref:MerR family transcriptional regulator n=1 Tax=Streptomyces phaeochromogenes TaxID=1923 RepID=A0ABZ1H350_STRPH|nr:MerR family transcriptional regulator [Streptomyces phaeochromogenes]WSD12885.1 MerR family transcriptional regulator [Streptomyces phaeochromogenes]